MKENALYTPTDEELVELLQNTISINQGFRLLVLKYQERLYWHIRRMVEGHDDTNDVLQNAFVKVFRGIDKFKGQSALYTWLYRIATNEALTFINKRKRKATEYLVMEGTGETKQLKADAYFDGDETQRRLKLAIAGLPQKQQLVFNLRYYDEMPYKQMSEVVGTSVGALKASYHHAVKKIELFFKQD